MGILLNAHMRQATRMVWARKKWKGDTNQSVLFYSHMLHFALNVQVTLSDQTQKVWVSTYSNVLYSLFFSFIQENTHKLSVRIYTHYSLAIQLQSCTKWGTAKRREEENSRVNREAACMNSRGNYSSDNFFFFPLKRFPMSARCEPAVQNQGPGLSSGIQYAVCHLKKYYQSCRHNWIKCSLFQKKIL